MPKNLTKYNKDDKIKEIRVKIHIIENNEFERNRLYRIIYKWKN